MLVFLYFMERLPCDLDELEDVLDTGLGDAGEVTGTGTGEMGSNIDIEVFDEDMTVLQAVDLIRKALAGFALPESSTIKIDDEEFALT